jgi:hypothetical protein
LNADATTAPAAVAPDRGLSMLAGALGNCGLGSRGMLHATPDLAEKWSFWLEKDGDRLVTKTRGDIVVVGAGYPGTGPDGNVSAGATDRLVWAYGTGLVEYRLGDPRSEPDELSQVLDRKQNRVRWYRKRTVGMHVDGCCTFAVRIDLDAPDS